MPEYLISHSQFQHLHDKLTKEQNFELAKKNWEEFDEGQKELVMSILETIYPKKSGVLKEAWYNTVMDILGIIDPTPIVDIINSISYFSQGENLFGLLTLISAVPYAGDIVGKPILGAAKVGSAATKELNAALKIMKTAQVGSKEYKAAGEIIEKLAKQPNVVGKFIQGMAGGNGQKVIKTVENIPAGPLKGFKNTILDWLNLLSNAGAKGKAFQGLSKGLAADFKIGKAGLKDVQALKDLLKAEKVFDAAKLSKPNFFQNVIYGGVPKIFGNRRLRIMMGQTKWWLGFLDYIGVANFVGPEEISKNITDEELYSKIEEYNKTPEAKNYFEEQFGEGNILSTNPPAPKPTSSGSVGIDMDPFADFLQKLVIGQLNPL